MELDLLGYIVPEGAVLATALFVIGVFLKKTPKVPDWWIVWIILGLGVLGAVALLWWDLGVVSIVQAIVQGVLIAGVPVLVYQLFKQSKERDSGNGDVV